MTIPNPAYVAALAVVDEAALRALEAVQPSELHPYGNTSLPRISEEQIPDEVRGYLGGTWGEHFALWPPAVALRHVKHARKVLDRHREYVDQCTGCGRVWPCPDVLDLASAWGVTL